MKRVTIACLLALLFCLLSGCLLESPDDLYELPSPGEDYISLKKALDAVSTSLGAEYAAPLTGSNTQTVQRVDLDGDGIQESAIAFFRVSNAEKPLRVYVFQQKDDVYEAVYVIQDDGTAINSVSYENLGGSQAKELIVSWQLSENVHTLVAYSLQDNEVVELMRSAYTKYEITDLDGDGESEIVLVQVNAAEGNNRAEFYDYSEGGMQLSSSAPMSLNVSEVDALKSSYLQDNVPAIYVTSQYGMDGGELTDVFALRDGELKNITLDPSISMSGNTMRTYTKVDPQDVNGDGILEIPSPEKMNSYVAEDSEGTGEYWLVNWNQYDIQGQAERVFTTFHNVSEGWYFIIPDSWVGNITVSQSSPLLGVQQTDFCLWLGEDTEPEPFLTIYKLTGTNRVMRAQMGERFELIEEEGNAIYAAEFLSGSWECGLDENGVKSRFNLIRTEWSNN